MIWHSFVLNVKQNYIKQKNMKSLKIIITGATGMVGEGVLHVSLQHPQVEEVLVIGRRPCGVTHPKLKEIVHADFLNLSSVEDRLSGYNACFFCLGTTSVGVSADDYYRSTYTLTLHVAETLIKLNPGMTFNYVSGAGTDSSEKGRLRWARVKGKTENDLMKLPFRQVFAFRPGFIKPIPGLSRINPLYKYVNWLFPIGRALYPAGFCILQELALAMINVISIAETRKVMEGKDIIVMGKG
jgi:uncharacterized protein YbjT (DUF2867 family)